MMWIVPLVLTAVISFYGASAKQSDNSENVSTPVSPVPSTTENNIYEGHTQLPVTSEIPIKPQNFQTEISRITYDQRQEGQYNIRADLENFLIVVVPPNPVTGLNLIDLLTRSSLKRSNLKKGQKKLYELSKGKPANKNEANLDYQRKQHSQYTDGLHPAEHYEFIEGRTPYRVDISSENEFPKTHPYAQVDVLPPIYPLDTHLIQPYLKTDVSIVPEAVIIPPKQDKPDNKKLLASDDAKHNKRSIDIQLYENPSFLTITDNQPPSDFFGSINLDDSYEYKARTTDGQAGWELKLIGATEQCGPDRIRNIYGICQFITHSN